LAREQGFGGIVDQVREDIIELPLCLRVVAVAGST